MWGVPHDRRNSHILPSGLSYLQQPFPGSLRQNRPDEMPVHFSPGVCGFDIFQVRSCPQVSRRDIKQHYGQRKAGIEDREDHSAHKKEPQSALTVCLSSSRKAVRLGLPNSSCLVYWEKWEARSEASWLRSAGTSQDPLWVEEGTTSPLLPETPPEPRPPRPRPCCPPGAQMHMIGSDSPLSMLGCHAIFERAAIFESCCSCDQREESEVSSGVQVRGDMSYKCTG